MAQKAEKVKFELPVVKFDILEGPVLAAIKEKANAGKAPKFSATAMSMSERMLKDINAGARVHLSTPSLMSGKDNVRKLLKRDLSRIAKRAGHKSYTVRIVDEGQALVFYYEQKAEKKVVEKAEKKSA